ncbi:hypothetical protein L209DRAFT_747005 [Thermothelomyces heterothallicus CBS 203.75]
MPPPLLPIGASGATTSSLHLRVARLRQCTKNQPKAGSISCAVPMQSLNRCFAMFTIDAAPPSERARAGSQKKSKPHPRLFQERTPCHRSTHMTAIFRPALGLPFCFRRRDGGRAPDEVGDHLRPPPLALEALAAMPSASFACSPTGTLRLPKATGLDRSRPHSVAEPTSALRNSRNEETVW